MADKTKRDGWPCVRSQGRLGMRAREASINTPRASRRLPSSDQGQMS